MCGRVGRYKGRTPLEWTYLLLGRKLCLIFDVGCGCGSWWREAPLWDIHTKRRICINKLDYFSPKQLNDKSSEKRVDRAPTFKQESGQISTFPHLGQSAAEHTGSLLTVTSQSSSTTHCHYPLPNTKGAISIYILLLVSMSHRVASLPQLPHPQPTANLWHNFLPSSKYVHSRGILPCISPPFCIFWHHTLLPNFGIKIGKYSIFPQT